MAGRLKVTLVKSTVGTNPSARGTVRALGLRHIGQSAEFNDDAAARGQVRAVRYLSRIIETVERGQNPLGHAPRAPPPRKID